MAAAQHRPQKPNMFRRILSPRDHKHDKGTKQQDKALRASSMSDMNSHRRDTQLQGSLEVENTVYRDPEQVHQQYPPAPPSSSFRSQSMVCSPVDGTNPPLPPRNTRPVSFSTGAHPLQRKQSNGPDESPLYMEPANTLKNSASMSNYVQVEPSEAVPTKKDLKKMTLYRETMEQSMEQKSGGGHRRVRSFGHVIDNSEYSTPFDLLKQNDQAKQRGEAVLPASVRAQLLYSQPPQRSASDKPPPKPPHVRKIRQAEPTPADADARIPVISPTPPGLSNRSHSNSPSSPHSTHSSEQELIRDDGTNDYDEPWDKKFINLPRMRTTTKSEGQIHDHLNDRASPPSPSFDRPRRPHRERDPVSISPDLLIEHPLAFVKGGLERNSVRNSGRRESSPSPLPPMREGRSLSSPQAPFNHHRLDQGERTTPVSMSKRLLPPTPSDVNERRILTREASPPPTIIDISIPLEDQPWYHGSISRSQAEIILGDHPDFSFLVRDSESNNTNFSLSIRDFMTGFIHLRVIKEFPPNPGYVLGQFSGNFETVQECISFYTKAKLNIRNADHKRLGLPIPRPNQLAKYRM